MKKLILLSLVLLGVLVAPFAMAQSRLINFQGNILDQQDKPYQGPVQMTFELFDKEFGGTQLWSEIQNVSLNSGYFNVYLGSVIPFADDFKFNRELWVQVTVGNGAPFKRSPLTMVPAAFASQYSDVAGFAQDIPDGSVTLAKLNDEVKNVGGDLAGQLPNPTLRPGAALANIEDGSIEQRHLSPNVTTRPSGPAAGDLTGFYPDPLIADGAVKTNRLADFAVTTEKLALGSVTYTRLQNAKGPIGTILGWDGTKWIETDVPTWEKGRVKNVLANDGAYATFVDDALGFREITVGVANNGITTAKIADDAVTYAKLQNAVNANGTILAWNGTTWYETTVPALEADGVIGNEILNATQGRGLQRVGLGTAADPYTIGIANGGVITEMIADRAVTLAKLANGTRNGQAMWWDSVNNKWALTVGTAMDNYVMRWFDNGVTRELRWSADDSFIGNEVVGAEYGRGLETYGLGTESDPLMLGIADNGVVTSMLADANVTYGKLQNAYGAAGTIIVWDGIQWAETTVPELEADGVIGNEVLDATAGRGLVRAGSGTEADPWTLGINENGVITDMIADDNVTYDKLQNAAGVDGTILGWVGGAWVETNVPMWEQGRQSAVTAGDGTYVINTTDANGFISTEVGIDMAGVENYMIAAGNVEYWHLQDAAGAAGTIIGWDGTDWTETNVPMWEAGRQSAVTAGDGTYVINTTDANGFISTEVGIDVAGVENYMIAAGAVEYWNLQDATGAAGTIIGWDGIAWTETNVATWEQGRQSEVTAGDGTYVMNTVDADGFISTEVGIDTDGVVTDMIADDAVTLDKLAPATEMGQVMYFDNLSNSWLLSSGMAPVEDQVIKWVDNGAGQLQPQWANDDITLPFFRVENEMMSLFTLINDANAPAMQLIGRTAVSDGLFNNSAFEVMNDAGGRGATIIGGTANDQNSGTPYEFSDPIADDDAALVVANYEHLNGAVYPAYTTAVRAYGDIWTNGRVGGEEGVFNTINVNTLNVIDLFAINATIENLTATNDAFFLSNVDIDGALDVAQDVHLNTDGGMFTTYTNYLNVANDAEIGNNLAVGNNALISNNLDVVNNALVGQDLDVLGLTTTENLLVNNNAEIFNLMAANAEVDNLQVNNAALFLSDVDIQGNLSVAQDVVLNTDGGFYTTYVNNLDVANDALVSNDLGVGNNAFVGNNFEVVNNALVGNDLEVVGLTTTNTLDVNSNAIVNGNLTVDGNTTLNGSLFVDDATTIDNNLTVAGASSLQATAVNGDLNANSRFIMSNTAAAGLVALQTAITNGFTVVNYSTNVPAELNLIGTIPAGTPGQVIYIVNSSTIGDITVGTLLNPVSVSQNQLVVLVFVGGNWIPMSN